jgi:hypothetical protein
MYHVDGGSGVQLIDAPNGDGAGPAAFRGLKTLGAAFGPDGDRVWHARAQGDWQYNAMLPRYQIAVYDRTTGESTTMTSRYGGGFRPAVSPDGRWLVYGSRHDTETGLRARDLETGEEHWVVYPIQRDDQESRATLDILPGYSFTPDSRSVVLAYDGRFWTVGIEPGADPRAIPFTADVELEAGARLDFDYPIDDSPTFLAQQIEELAPSPDGRLVAFTALDRLYVADHTAGSAPREIATGVEGGLFQPVWSPDGSSIAFVSWHEQDGGHLWRVSPSGGDLRQLTEAPAGWSDPAWSADGARIVALRSSARARRESGGFGGAGSELAWVPAVGGAHTVIAPASGRRLPHFHADAPDRIYLSAGGTLVSVRWDGTDEKSHVRVTGFPGASGGAPNAAQAVRMAPTGDMAMAVASDQLYVLTVPRVGGSVPTVSVRNPEAAIVPVRQVSELGAWFPEWAADGRTLHWTLGSGHFVYDLDRAEAVEDSLAALEPTEADEAEDPGDAADPAEEEEEAGDADEPGYRATEHRVEVSIERDLPRGAAALVGGRVITMDGDEIIEDGVVVVRDNRIEDVGARGSVTIPDDARVIDVTGRTVMPGFVDTHAHLRPSTGIHRPVRPTC